MKPPPKEHYIGPYCLQVFPAPSCPGRARYEVTGPASEDLPAALVAALTHFIAKPTP